MIKAGEIYNTPFVFFMNLNVGPLIKDVKSLQRPISSMNLVVGSMFEDDKI